MKLLETYSVCKTREGSFTLTFKTTENVVVLFNEDNTIALSEGESSTTSYSKNYKSVKGKLRIAFKQNFGDARIPVVEDPIIDIEDKEI